jgi:glycine dehydrogenase subunit 1
MTLLGGEGLAKLARINHARARKTAEALAEVPGVTVVNTAYVNEFTVILPRDAREVVRELADYGVLGGVSLGRLYPDQPGLANGLVVAATEVTSDDDIHALQAVLADLLVDTHEGSPT